MMNISWFLKNLEELVVVKLYVFVDFMGYIFKGYNGYFDFFVG